MNSTLINKIKSKLPAFAFLGMAALTIIPALVSQSGHQAIDKTTFALFNHTVYQTIEDTRMQTIVENIKDLGGKYKNNVLTIGSLDAAINAQEYKKKLRSQSFYDGEMKAISQTLEDAGLEQGKHRVYEVENKDHKFHLTNTFDQNEISHHNTYFKSIEEVRQHALLNFKPVLQNYNSDNDKKIEVREEHKSSKNVLADYDSTIKQTKVTDDNPTKDIVLHPKSFLMNTIAALRGETIERDNSKQNKPK